MVDGKISPICMSKYTNEGDHRIVATKCGHLFCNSCIEVWLISKNKCPKCFLEIERQDCKYIYVESIETIDNSKILEIEDKYKDEIYLLNKRVKVLKNKLLNDSFDLTSTFKFDYVFSKNIDLSFISEMFKIIVSGSIAYISCKLNESLLPLNNYIIMSSLYHLPSKLYQKNINKNTKYGILIINLDQFNYKFIKTGFKVTDIKVNHRFLLFSFSRNIKVYKVGTWMNVYNKAFEFFISSVAFSVLSESKIFIGDSKGQIHAIDIYINTYKKIIISDKPILSIIPYIDLLYEESLLVMCIFQLYQVSNDFIDEIIGSNSGYILSSLDYDTKFFLTLKDTNHHINVCLFGTDMEVVFWELSKKQKYRCYNKIFKNYLIIVNCDVCGLEIYNTNKICSLYNIYRLPFKIVDFDINDNNLVILTEKTIEFYKNYNGRR